MRDNSSHIPNSPNLNSPAKFSVKISTEIREGIINIAFPDPEPLKPGSIPLRLSVNGPLQ